VRPLHDVPSEVQPARARADDIDLLPGVLPDVGDPQVAVGPVEAHPPRVAESGQPDLGSRVSGVEKWVVRRDPIARIGVRAAVDSDVDPQHLRQERVEMPSRVERIAPASTIARADVEEAVRPEDQRAAVVIGEPVGHRQPDPGRVRIGTIRVGT
jgi:hypothetical protein